MWKVLWPEVPKSLMLGQGYSVSGAELEMVATRRTAGTFGEDFGGAALAGDYHNGPLSVLVPFGIWGALGFLWFLIAGLRALYRNYRYGDPQLRVVNAFLLASFLATTCLFFFIFGSLYGDMMKYAGIVGLSVTLNGGVRQPVTVPMAEEEKPVSFASVLPRPRPVFGR
jgi:O-antigen ligase